MVRPRIYFPGTLWQFYEFAQPILEPECEIVVEPDRVYRPEELAIVFVDVDGAILTAFEKIPRTVLEAAPRLRALSKYGAGIEAIDLEAATALGIPVTNTPGANALGVAEHTVALILSLLRHTPRLDRLVKAGGWTQARRLIGGDVEGSTLGLVGFGNIGQLVGRKMSALGMRVLAFDPYQPAEVANAAGAHKVESLDDLLAAADVVSLHLTVTAATRRMFDAVRLSRMKRGAYLVNTSRAALIDEAALIAALQSNELAGAALDVFDQEPIEPGHPLLRFETAILTPHHAGTTIRTRERTLKQAADNLVRVLKGELPEFGLCNPDVRLRFKTDHGSAPS